MTFLRGLNVHLRRLEPTDLEQTLQWVNEPEIFVLMGVFGPRTSIAQQHWYEEVSVSQTNLVFAVCLQDGGEHVGNASIFDIDLRNRNAGLTIVLPDRAHQGKGLGREAVGLLCRYGFDYLNLHRIYCKTDSVYAGKMYERLGFVREGVLRQQAFRFGEFVDKVVYGVLRDEFREASKASQEESKP